jgi:hypothetical protein
MLIQSWLPSPVAEQSRAKQFPSEAAKKELSGFGSSLMLTQSIDTL